MMGVVYRETFVLVGHGFSHDSLAKMPIALRRYYFKMYQDKLEAEAGNPNTPKGKAR